MASKTRNSTVSKLERPGRPERPERPDPLAAFHPAVREWFLSALGEPTLAQELAWPHIKNAETTLLLAPTGSGKTLAAFLSAIDRLGQEPRSEAEAKSKLRVLYVSPLKALAVDVERNLRAPLAGVAEAAARLGTPLRRLDVAVRTGDTSTSERAKILRAPPDILITTPESLYLLLTSAQRELLAAVDTVIIDEIHQMAASKRGAHLFLSLERLQAMRPERPLQRIGLSATQRPLEEIARLLGGFEESAGTGPTKAKTRTLTPRPVAIVDASAKKALSITVEVPPPLPDGVATLDDEMEAEPDARSIWPALHARLVERIRAARSTMIFVNSRRLAERLATALNETAGEEIALAHHGSVAKDSRRAIEERLKAGELPAIVATSSLELGIDMGAVDQVIQVEAPPSVASGIQRIGRASHHVGGVPSGVLVPKHKQDLLACAAAAAGIESGDVEETYYARNPLDVLAQQIVAVAAVGIPRVAPLRPGKPKRAKKDAEVEREVETDVEAIWDLVRRAAPFAELPRTSFDGVLDMLAGRYPSDEFADLRARITWDRTRGVVTPRAGAKRLAIQNAGTIPDRGLYGVFLQDGNDSGDREGDDRGGKQAGESTTARKNKSSKRVGELDEEMVFELREGEVFLLGASSWRTEQITRDRVLVTPAAGIPGKMPFWHGDRAGRTVAFGTRIGKLTRTIAGLGPAEATRLLHEEHHLDARSAVDLIAYVKDELAATGTVPSDKTIVVERVPDELGDLRICVLTPFGSRIHAPWAMATLRKLREARAGDIEAVSTDDGIVFRVPGGEEPLPVELLFPSPDEIEDAVTRELGGSSMFAARFREAAARALLLPRNHIGKRTPLWAQRKRAADLLAVAQQYPSFPIVLETYRECLRDAFDLPALVDVLRAVESRKIRVTTVDLTTPSPMAASLLFSFVGNFIYDEDAPAAERRAQALTIDHAQLRELLGETELRKLLDADVVLEHGRQLQRLDRPLRHGDGLHDLLLWLGDLGDDEIRRRTDPALVTDGKPAVSAATVTGWIDSLVRDRRIVRVRIAGEERYVAVEDVARYRDALGVVLERGLPEAFTGPTKDALTSLVARYARTHGPFTAGEIAARWGLGEASVSSALDRLVGAGKVVTGTFLASSSAARARGRTTGAPLEYCDAEVLQALKRKTLARLRKSIEPVAPETFARFLGDWQGIIAPDDARAARIAASPTEALLRAIGQLEGCPVPASVLESEILPARVPGYRSHLLDQLLASGEVVWAGIEPIGANDGRVALYLSDREPLLARGPATTDAIPSGALHAKLRELFERRGALFFAEITRTLATYPADVLGSLWDLVWAGEVTNDTLEPLRSSLAAGRKTERRGRPSPRPARLGPRGSEGRWSLRRSRWERVPTSTERATAIAKAMLERYGIVLREAPHAEGLPGGFANVYDVYRALEDQGRVRRGYFVAERGATQFALPGAEERLRTKRPDDEEPRTLVLAATDPANPWGSLLPWPRAEAPRSPLTDGEPPLAVEAPAAPGRSPQRAPGARVVLHDGRLVAWIGRGGQNIATFLPRDEPELTHAGEALARALVGLARRRARAAMLVTIDGAPALESPFAKVLHGYGFLGRRGALVFIPTVPRASAPEGRRGELARAFSERGVVSFDGGGAPPPASARPSAPPSGHPPSLDGEEWDADDVDFDADELGADLEAIGAEAALDLDTPPDEPSPPGSPTPGAHA